MPPPPKEDRRQRRTRAALHQALTALADSRPFAAITIEDIVETADIARATFYAHYRDRNELLLAVTTGLMQDLAERVAAVQPSGTTYSGLGARAVFEHAKQNAGLYRVLITGEGGPEARGQFVQLFIGTATRTFETFVRSSPVTPRMPLPVVATAFAGALLAVVEAWLGGSIKGTPRVMAESFMQGHTNGLEWSLGFGPGGLSFVEPPAAS